jgi:methylated-DNA-[protein]-cysteine S-methyltransferase
MTGQRVTASIHNDAFCGTSMTMRSPVGRLRLYAIGRELVGLYLPAQAAPAGTWVDHGTGQGTGQGTGVLGAAAAQLTEYFAGQRRAFDLPLAPRGTAFQRSVWGALLAIRHGETRSYGELAQGLDRPSASRAVGAANGRNPISIIVPCHRVVGSTGELTGYAGGLAAKRWLLDHERAHAAPPAGSEKNPARRGSPGPARGVA